MDTASIGSRLQSLPQRDQALVLARLASSRTDDGSFSPSGLRDAFDSIGLPRPAKPANVLLTLEKAKLATRRSTKGMWWLTPIGRDRSVELMGGIDLQVALAEAASGRGAALGLLTHSVLDPTWAPPELIAPLAGFLAEFPFDTNVFAMTRFPKDTEDGEDPDVLVPCISALRTTCAAHGLTLHLASDRSIVDDLWSNVLAHMWACRYGIAIFEDHVDRGINYNLTIEVGGMLLAGRRTALLKDHTVPSMPTDLVGKIYRSVDLKRPTSVASSVHSWIREDLRLGSCGECDS